MKPLSEREIKILLLSGLSIIIAAILGFIVGLDYSPMPEDVVVEVPVERVVEKVVEVPVDRVVEKIVRVPVDRVVEVERIVEVPVERNVETVVEVERIVEVPRLAAASQAVTLQPERAVTAGRLGVDVTVGTTVWRITQVRDLGTLLKSREPQIRADQRAAAGTKFVSVSGVVMNTGLEEHFRHRKPLVVDYRGRVYSEVGFSTWLFVPEEQHIGSNRLRPGIPRAFTDVFEVPADSRIVAIRVGDAGTVGRGPTRDISVGR